MAEVRLSIKKPVLTDEQTQEEESYYDEEEESEEEEDEDDLPVKDQKPTVEGDKTK